jgi:uncharacterized integral membrane protein
MSERPVGGNERQGSAWTGRLIAAAIILALLLLFVLLNSEEVEIDILVADTDIRLGFALLLSGALGFLAGFLMPRSRRP